MVFFQNTVINKHLKVLDKQAEGKWSTCVSPIGKKGYKFPCNEKEIAQFYDRFISNIIPQIKCIGILNKVLVAQSIGKFNILIGEKYSTLNSLVDIISNHKLNEPLI